MPKDGKRVATRHCAVRPLQASEGRLKGVMKSRVLHLRTLSFSLPIIFPFHNTYRINAPALIFLQSHAFPFDHLTSLYFRIVTCDCRCSITQRVTADSFLLTRLLALLSQLHRNM